MVATEEILRARLAVAVLTRDRPERLKESLHAATLALQGADGAILVINNGTRPVPAPRHTGGIACRVVNTGANLGVAARNLALSNTDAEFLLMIDDDAAVPPSAGKDLMAAFAAVPRAGAVAFRVHGPFGEEACLLPSVFHGCACAFRTTALRAIGGYPEDFGYYGEEYDIAFRLYTAGYRILQMDRDGGVRHLRDPSGRSPDRIVSRLIRNNTRLWCSSLPAHQVWPAIRDTVWRYYLVARRERAVRGFMHGCLGLPSAALRGLKRRRPMAAPCCASVTLADKVRSAALRLRASGIQHVVVCGVGKFPSLWIRILRLAGLLPVAFWDRNPCWKGRSVAGIPVVVVEPGPSAGTHPNAGNTTAWLTGTSSQTDNATWEAALRAMGLDCRPSAPREATSASPGTIDLLDSAEIRCFLPIPPNPWAPGGHLTRWHRPCFALPQT